MAPPGFGPPGYSIPQRYRQREPLPDGADTNTRPYLIFLGYLTTCIYVSALITVRALGKFSILRRSKHGELPSRSKVWLFSLLATGSLIATWTHMLRYFKVSYQTWLMWRSYYELEPHHKHWGLWLRETSLFQEFWETIIIGNARYWWSHQVFFFALALGLYLEQKGLRRGVEYTWAFMLLGQIASISFATNLFFLTLLSTPLEPSQKVSKYEHRKWVRPWILNLVAIVVTTYTAMLLADEHYWHHPTAFMPVLLAPHIGLLLLPLARASLPAKYLVEDTQHTTKIYDYMWVLMLCNASLMLLWTTTTAYSYAGLRGIQHALHEHPAVSSVGYDVIFCWLSWLSWLWGNNDCKRREPRDIGRRMTDGDVHHSTHSMVIDHDGHDSDLRRR